MCERSVRWPGADDEPVHPVLGLRPAGSQAGLAQWLERAAPQPEAVPPRRSPSRRRRLWELSRHAQCPVVGTCMALDRLRELGARHFTREVLADDYALHSAAVSASSQRSEFAERLQRELDERWALPVQRARALADAQALKAHWREAVASGEFAAALWVVLTHPCCDLALEERLLNEVHMLQHQVGMATRADLRRLQQLQREQEALQRELAQAQERLVRQAADKAADKARALAGLQDELSQLRVLLLERDARVAALQVRCDALEARAAQAAPVVQAAPLPSPAVPPAAVPDRPVLLHRRSPPWRGVPAAASRAAGIAQPDDLAAQDGARCCPDEPVACLRDKAVLCVGGRAASVPVYRRLVESRGARFLHHDGGSEDSALRLDRDLEAADVVLCQAGCVSHDAYWRVKDHCKRTGKRCVYLARPSAAGLLRGLVQLGGAAGLASAPARA